MQQCRRLERFPPRRLKREVGTGVIEHAELGCGDPTKAIVIFTSHCGDQRKPSCAGDILIHTNQRQIEFGIAVTATLVAISLASVQHVRYGSKVVRSITRTDRQSTIAATTCEHGPPGADLAT